MFALLITTLEANTIQQGKNKSIINRPVATTTANFMSEEARNEAVRRIDEYNFKRKQEDMIHILGHISYLYIKL